MLCSNETYKMKRIIKTTISLVFALVLLSCTKTISKESPLIERGILPLSSNNPYLGSNVFLSREMSQSPLLFNFVKEKGGPQALEISSPSLNQFRMYLYYPYNNEVYSCDRQGHSADNGKYEWIISGPYRMSRNQYKTLEALLDKPKEEPPFIVDGKVVRFKEVKQAIKVTIEVPKVTPTPIPTPVKKIKKHGHSSHAPTKSATPAPTIAEVKVPLNSDQQAIAISQGFAERASNGDLLHAIKGENESLEEVTKWYTGTTTHAERIAEYNHLEKPWTLKKSEKLKIPAALVHELKQMK